MREFFCLLKKDLKLMISGRFFILSVGTLILYSCYINFVYVNVDQDIYPVYIYDPQNTQAIEGEPAVRVSSREELIEACKDAYSVGIDASYDTPQIYMKSSGIETTDNYRAAWAVSALDNKNSPHAEIIGNNNKEMKSRREITAEFLFFELIAVGFLGLASILFKEKFMGVIRVHGILPISKTAFILSKLILVLLSDLLFCIFLTLINVGVHNGLLVLPAVMVHTGILSLIMALAGFLCAILLKDFKQFSLLYLVMAIFITIPVFLAVQTKINWEWIDYHPMYHMFMAMKNAYFEYTAAHGGYYFICFGAIVLLFVLVYRALACEMERD